MATKIRMTRMGSKKSPSYRLVVSDSRNSRDGEYIEQIGFFNPLTNPVDLRIDKEKAQKWLNSGAQPTETVKALFVKAGVEFPTKKNSAVKLEKKQPEKKATRKTTTKKTETK